MLRFAPSSSSRRYALAAFTPRLLPRSRGLLEQIPLAHRRLGCSKRVMQRREELGGQCIRRRQRKRQRYVWAQELRRERQSVNVELGKLA
jgi:hypothetical protein